VVQQTGNVRAKLTIGQPGDRYEQEADRVAEQVVGMPESSGAGKVGAWNSRTMCPECEEERSIQTSTASAAAEPGDVSVSAEIGRDRPVRSSRPAEAWAFWPMRCSASGMRQPSQPGFA
jgi:hypothetical protein